MILEEDDDVLFSFERSFQVEDEALECFPTRNAGIVGVIGQHVISKLRVVSGFADDCREWTETNHLAEYVI
jgi:hypothetical protein